MSSRNEESSSDKFGRPLSAPAAWCVLFVYRFRAAGHMNLLELAALTSLLRRLNHQGVRRQRILCCVDSRGPWASHPVRPKGVASA